jgi:hypothetical protein
MRAFRNGNSGRRFEARFDLQLYCCVNAMKLRSGAGNGGFPLAAPPAFD